MPIKILFYSPLGIENVGGFERWMIDVGNRLSDLGHIVTLVTTDFPHNIENVRGGSCSRDKERKFEWIRLSGMRLPIGAPLISPADFASFLSKIKDNDVLYFNCCPPNNFIVPLLLTTKKPVICAFHFFLDPDNLISKVYYRTFLRRTSTYCQGFHVLNKKSSDLLKSWNFKRVYCIPNGVNTGLFRYTHVEREERFRVLFVGSLTYVKGFDILCALIKNLLSTEIGTNLLFTIVGSGPLKNLAESLCERHSNVKYFCSVPHDCLPEIYSSHDLLVMPSRKEGMPLVALEAQSCGLPIIALDIPGVNDIVINGKTGVLLASPTREDLLEEIIKFYRLWEGRYDDYVKTRIGIAKYAERFDLNYTINKLERMLSDIVSWKRAR